MKCPKVNSSLLRLLAEEKATYLAIDAFPPHFILTIRLVGIKLPLVLYSDREFALGRSVS